MSLLSQFEPPANLGDFNTIPEQRAAWDEFLSLSFDVNVEDVENGDAVGTGRCQFYNPKKVQTDNPISADVIRWKGFPLLINANHPGNKPAAWAEADKLKPAKASNGKIVQIRQQDEYLEWHVSRNTSGKITKVSFTCEGPEYWQALARGYPVEFDLPRSSGGLGGARHTNAMGDKQKLLSIYQQLVSPQIQLVELLDSNGDYNPYNKWNTTDGAVHLIQPNNTLGAEINIAARATVLRQKNGQVVTDPNVLINCSGFGQAGRASDPHIGDEVNKLARSGFAITLANPVGLYIDSLETTGWVTPNGKPAAQFWSIIRGTPGMVVHATFEVPAAEGYLVSDIKIGGIPIQFGGQIAENINMKLTGIACRQNSFHNPPQATCPAEQPQAAHFIAMHALPGIHRRNR